MTSAAELPLPRGMTVQRALRLSRRGGGSAACEDPQSCAGSSGRAGALQRAQSQSLAASAANGSNRAARRAGRAASLPATTVVKQHLYEADCVPARLDDRDQHTGTQPCQQSSVPADLLGTDGAPHRAASSLPQTASEAVAHTPGTPVDSADAAAGTHDASFSQRTESSHARRTQRVPSRGQSGGLSRGSSAHAPLVVPVQTLSMPDNRLDAQPPLPPMAPAAVPPLPAPSASRGALRRQRSQNPANVACGALSVSRPPSRAESFPAPADPLHACMQDAIDRALVDIERSAAARERCGNLPVAGGGAGTDSDGSNTSSRRPVSHVETQRLSETLLEVCGACPDRCRLVHSSLSKANLLRTLLGNARQP